MLRHQFPNLKWLQSQADNKLFNPQDAGWPHVIMNTKTSMAYRPNIRGPMSLFMNVHGFSHCTVENRRVLIHPDMFYLTQPDQYYSLEIENPELTETWNIHFKERFQDLVYSSLILRDDAQLTDPKGVIVAPEMFNTTYSKKPFESKFKVMYQEFKHGVDSLREEEILWDLMIDLLQLRMELEHHLSQLPGLKKSTREEMFKRLSFSKDFIQSCFQSPLHLEQLASSACMSKYHFLRAFKACFGITPHQFVLKVRLNQAKILLKHSNMSATQIALESGFDNSASFSKIFYKHIGVSPTAFREKAK